MHDREPASVAAAATPARSTATASAGPAATAATELVCDHERTRRLLTAVHASVASCNSGFQNQNNQCVCPQRVCNGQCRQCCDNTHCAGNQTCNNGTCTKQSNGGSCASDGDCMSSNCSSGRCCASGQEFLDGACRTPCSPEGAKRCVDEETEERCNNGRWQRARCEDLTNARPTACYRYGTSTNCQDEACGTTMRNGSGCCEDAACGPNGVCVNRVCKSRVGALCFGPNECAPGLTCEPVDANGTMRCM